MSSYKKALKFLQRIEKKRGIKLGLKRVENALTLFGNPHLKIEAVHVAGTNGKGSVCTFTAEILKEAGYKTGLFTSPYIYEPTEKIRINGRKISTESYGKLILEIKKITEKAGIKLTFFEFNSVASFVYFARNKVDFAVLETGMGGRLDATNVCKGRVAVITNIRLEHEKYLGKTKLKIAKEKGAIIKRGQIVVTAEKNKKILELFGTLCRRNKAKLVVIKRGVNYKLGLKGSYQKINAACADKAAKILKIKRKFILRGLKNAFWPARFQIVRKNPLLLVDAAHNPAGIESLVASLRKEFPHRKFTFVIGFSEGKKYKEMLRLIAPLASEIQVGKASYHGMEKRKIIKEGKNYVPAGEFKGIKNRDTVLCGSIYFIAETIDKSSLLSGR